MTSVTVNGRRYNVNLPDDTPLLWALRDELGLTGTKYGCGMALCGACTVHLDGEPARACTTPASAAAGKKITTIEGIGAGSVGKAVQAAWVALEVLLGEDALVARLAAPEPLDAAQLLQPPLDARLPQRVLNHRAQRLALRARQGLRFARKRGGQRNGFLDDGAHQP